MLPFSVLGLLELLEHLRLMLLRYPQMNSVQTDFLYPLLILCHLSYYCDKLTLCCKERQK